MQYVLPLEIHPFSLPIFILASRPREPSHHSPYSVPIQLPLSEPHSVGTGTRSAQRAAGWKPSKLPTDPTRRCRLVRLFERERAKSPEERGEREPAEEEDVEDARRWRCMRRGSTSGMLAIRAKMERTGVVLGEWVSMGAR